MFQLNVRRKNGEDSFLLALLLALSTSKFYQQWTPVVASRELRNLLPVVASLGVPRPVVGVPSYYFYLNKLLDSHVNLASYVEKVFLNYLAIAVKLFTVVYKQCLYTLDFIWRLYVDGLCFISLFDRFTIKFAQNGLFSRIKYLQRKYQSFKVFENLFLEYISLNSDF